MLNSLVRLGPSNRSPYETKKGEAQAAFLERFRTEAVMLGSTSAPSASTSSPKPEARPPAGKRKPGALPPPGDGRGNLSFADGRADLAWRFASCGADASAARRRPSGVRNPKEATGDVKRLDGARGPG